MSREPRSRSMAISRVHRGEPSAARAVRSRYSFANVLARWTFLATVALAPLLFGGNIPLAWGVNAALMGCALVVFSLDHAARGRPFPVSAAWIAVPLGAVLLVCTWVALQTVEWMPRAWHNPIWARAGSALGEPVPGSISVAPWETRLALLRLTTAVAAVWLALQIGRDPTWARRILLTVGLAAAGYCCYGLVVRAAGSPTVLWVEKREFRDVLTATFVNPNHFAMLAALGILAIVGLLLRAARHAWMEFGFSGTRGALSGAIAAGRVVAFYAAPLFAMLSALVLSGSRAGLALTTAAMFALFVLDRARRSVSLAPLVLGVCAIAGLLLLGSPQSDRLGAELASSNAGDLQSRLDVAEVVLRAAHEAPVAGFGYGSFADVFPSYQGTKLPFFLIWNEAHNSYLEAILGLGAPAAALLFLAVGVLVARCFVGALRRKRDRSAPQVAAAASIIIGVHALVDFSIQLQGVTLVYCALLGAGCAQSWGSGHGRRAAQTEKSPDFLIESKTQ